MKIQELIPHLEHLAPDREAEERAAMRAVLESSIFAKRPRLASLLEYICGRYFQGDTDAIKEYLIATEVFHRPPSFDQATDSIVRVEFFRLRKRLREFYDGEGADQPIEIVVATGHYRPQFIDRISPAQLPNNIPDSLMDSMFPAAATNTPLRAEEFFLSSNGNHPPPEDRVHAEDNSPDYRDKRIFGWRSSLSICAILMTLVAAAYLIRGHNHGWFANPKAASSASTAATVPLAAGPEIRIRCGYARPIFKDEEGNIWTGDRYFTGGFATELPNQHIARTRNPELYLSARTGVFSYRIPLAPGTYELHLHFAETTYSPASSLGGGENSRVFDVQLNGRPLLSQFDIVSDAGADTADVRVFRDVTPDKDGALHLDFSGSLGLPILNAIEILPGLPHRLRPIRMVAQNSFFVDKSGNLWMPDTYFNSGQLAADKVAVGGTQEPGLYAGERYGNFSYALPVDKGRYKITLYFSEKYWGSELSKQGGVGSRVFDLFCNGVALTRRLDIVEAAGSGRALVKTYHDLHPNAQGKLILSFVPDVNYASVNAVEVEEETR
jgi:hypothetical protein